MEEKILFYFSFVCMQGLAVGLAVGAVRDVIRDATNKTASSITASSSTTDRTPGKVSTSSGTAGAPLPHSQKATYLLSDQNLDLIASTLCRMRGAALKLGQMLSIQVQYKFILSYLDLFFYVGVVSIVCT
jgi:predicted unusual protein kinase regulating ubiquinone biosynthesis (AarF/ABC1/UbiB family)